jgi:hypothetical protein
LQNLLEKITKKHRERQTNRVSEYLDLVRSISDEEEPDPDHVDQVLRDCGKSFEDLRQAVLVRQQRKDLRAQLDRITELQKERPKLEKQVAAADRELEEAENRHAAVTAPLNARLEEIRTAAQGLVFVRQKLEESCDNPLVREPLNEVRAQLKQLSNRQCELRKKINDSTEWAKSDRQELTTEPTPTRTEQLTERAQINEAVVAKCQEELTEVEKELTSLRQKEAALQQQAVVA